MYFYLPVILEEVIKLSDKEVGINLLFCVSLPGYTWLCGLKYTDIKLQTLQVKEIISTLENIIRGGNPLVTGYRYVKLDANKNIIYILANTLYGWAMSESLPYDETNIDKNVELEDSLNTPDDSKIGYFVEIDINYPDKRTEKNQELPF